MNLKRLAALTALAVFIVIGYYAWVQGQNNRARTSPGVTETQRKIEEFQQRQNP